MNTCDFCGKEFTTYRGLCIHQKQYCNAFKSNLKNKNDCMKYTCTACGKRFAEKKSLHGHRAKCGKYQSFVNETLSYDFLYDNFITNNFTARYISLALLKGNISVSTIINKANAFNIKTKTIKEAANLATVREKYKTTCVKKYNAENALSKNTSAYKKRNDTVEKKYGVTNVFQLASVKDTSKSTIIKRYGVETVAHIPGIHKNNGRKSKPHLLIEQILSDLKINYESEQNNLFIKYNTELNRKYCPRPDIVIPDKRIAIEINGDRWHANPKIYKASDIIPLWRGNFTALEIWNLEAIRIRHIESFGYTVFVLWEYDIRHNIEIVKQQIKTICSD